MVRKRPYGAMVGMAGTAYRGFQYAAKVARVAKKMHSGMKSRSGKGGGSGGANALTSQHDIKSMKRRKRTSKKSLRRKTAFRNKITKALEPLDTHHSYTEIGATATTIIKSSAINPLQEQYPSNLPSQDLTINAGTTNGAGVTRIKDAMHNLATQSQLADGAIFLQPPSEKQLTILSSQIELSLRNLYTAVLVFDVYWCVATTTRADSAHATPGGTWNTLLAANTNFGIIGDKALATDNGVTPQDAIGFGKYWKVLSKTRVLLGGGSTTEMKFTGGRYHYNPQKFDGQSIVAGFTKGLLIVGGIGDNSGLGTGAEVYRYHTTRSYRFKYPHGKDQLPNRPTNTSYIF
jgi:hypothetical protein